VAGMTTSFWVLTTSSPTIRAFYDGSAIDGSHNSFEFSAILDLKIPHNFPTRKQALDQNDTVHITKMKNRKSWALNFISSKKKKKKTFWCFGEGGLSSEEDDLLLLLLLVLLERDPLLLVETMPLSLSLSLSLSLALVKEC